MAAVLLLLCCPAAAAATARPAQRAMHPLEMVDVKDGEPPCTTTTDAVLHAAQRACGSAPVDKALIAVGLHEGVEAAGRALAGLGLRTTTDLRLLGGGGPEAEELMGELMAAGVLLGDRAKIRLLVGDRAHIDPARGQR